jgi:hypothetical protein
MRLTAQRNALALTIALTAGAAQAATVVVLEENFDDPQIDRNWEVVQTFGPFESVDGAGIEIQRNAVVTAHSGNQYVELDSDTDRGGIKEEGTNSSMTATLDLIAGLTTVTWWYQPRPNNGSTAGTDNGIDVFFNEVGLGEFGTLIGEGSQPNQANNATGGQWVYNSFSVYTPGGDYYLTFAADGNENEYGGFIDTVRVTTEVPAPSTLALFGLGLAGLGAIKRLRRRG